MSQDGLLIPHAFIVLAPPSSSPNTWFIPFRASQTNGNHSNRITAILTLNVLELDLVQFEATASDNDRWLTETFSKVNSLLLRQFSDREKGERPRRIKKLSDVSACCLVRWFSSKVRAFKWSFSFVAPRCTETGVGVRRDGALLDIKFWQAIKNNQKKVALVINYFWRRVVKNQSDYKKMENWIRFYNKVWRFVLRKRKWKVR